MAIYDVVSNCPEIDNVEEYYLTSEEKERLKENGMVLVDIDQRVNKD